MSDSVYKVIEVIGTSSTSWEEAAKTAVDKVASHLEDVRVAEVVELDLRLEENKVMAYRAKVKVSFKYSRRRNSRLRRRRCGASAPTTASAGKCAKRAPQQAKM